MAIPSASEARFSACHSRGGALWSAMFRMCLAPQRRVEFAKIRGAARLDRSRPTFRPMCGRRPKAAVPTASVVSAPVLHAAAATRHLVRCSCPRGPFSGETNPRARPTPPYGPCQLLARPVGHQHPIARADAPFDALRLDEVLCSDRPYRKRRYVHPAWRLVACLVREDPFRV